MIKLMTLLIFLSMIKLMTLLMFLLMMIATVMMNFQKMISLLLKMKVFQELSVMIVENQSCTATSVWQSKQNSRGFCSNRKLAWTAHSDV